MKYMEIKLNDILKLPDLKNTKIRFNLQYDNIWNPLEFFNNHDLSIILDGQYWNYNKKSYPGGVGTTTIGFIPLNKTQDTWLLIHVGKITRDLNIYNGPGYEYEFIHDYDNLIGRLVIRWHNPGQNMIRLANNIIDDLIVYELLPVSFNQDIFPGYDKVNVDYKTLAHVIQTPSWKTALENQKAVYLLTDTYTGKLYIGSAYGRTMLLGRWQQYIDTGHGNNVELIKLGKSYINQHFRYSILEIFKSTTADKIILERESWWKGVLQTRIFGYNSN